MPCDAVYFRDHALDLLDFWRTRGVDREHGGFLLDLDRRGHRGGDSRKHVVGSARAVYTFSQGVLLDGPAWCAELARHGARFLLDRFRDAEHDGWFWCLDREGNPLETCKRTYGHAFAMLALTEFHRATGDPTALAAAERTFDLMEEHLWEAAPGAYCEGRDRDWARIVPPWRGQNCNMHALEAVLALYEVTGRPRYRDRVADLCRLMANVLFDEAHGCIHEDFRPDWTVDPDRRGDQISIGHQFEWAWLLMRAEAIVPQAVRAVHIDRLMDFGLRFGWDERFGGVFTYATPAGETLNDRKGYWENCEAVMALAWYGKSGDSMPGGPSPHPSPTGRGSKGEGRDRRPMLSPDFPRYEALFQQAAEFCFTRLADAEFGGWFDSVARDGTPAPDAPKGGLWKADYHVIQMCAELHRFLG